jgi:Transglycosylase SLT domain
MTVPAQYQSLLSNAAQSTGIPEPVVDAQVNDESGFNPRAVSPAGAEGMFQFLPSTYDDVAQQAGVQPGTEFNPADEERAYVVYMNQLLQEEGGSIFKALEAYNAGPDNLGAGSGYASGILAAADEPASASAGAGSGNTQSAGDDSALGGAINIFGQVINPLGDIESILGSSAGSGIAGEVSTAIDSSVSDLTQAQWQSFMQITGISGVKDLMIRGGLLLLGLIIFIVGLVKLLNISPVQNTVEAGKAAAGTTGIGKVVL